MARAIHIAVNLLLIVALTLQPGLAYAVQQHCSAGIVGGIACQGCGSCKVHSESAKCPCCGVEAADKQGGCCGHRDQHTCGDSTVTSAPFAGMMPEVGPATENPVPKIRAPQDSVQLCDDDRPQVRTASATALAVCCHCVSAPEPSGGPVPRSSTPELRDVLTITICCDGDEILSAQPPLSPAFNVAHRPVVDHFSQIAFCVWRL